MANHSFAQLEAEERGLREVLETEFPLLEGQLLVDALVYCDMTTTPDGERFIRRASLEIFAAVERVEGMLAAQPR